MSRKSFYSWTVSDSGNTGTFVFEDGASLTIDRNSLPVDVQEAAFWHGIKQKCIDSAAMPRDTANGQSASTSEKIHAMRRTAEQLTTSWNAVRGSGEAEGGLLLRALCELYPAKTREQVATWLAGKSKSEQAALRADAKIKPIIERLRPAAPANVDTDAMLDELAD